MTEDSIHTPRSRRPYGGELAENFGIDGGPFVVTRSLSNSEIAVTEINVVRPFGETSAPLPRQDAYMVVYHLKDLRGMPYREDGHPFAPGEVRAGGATIHDLRREPVVLVDRPLHTIQWFVPRAALNAAMDVGKAPYADHLRHEPGVAVYDDVLTHLNLALLPALRAAEQVSRIFIDSMTAAFAAHLAEGYGGAQVSSRPPFRGGLTPWQERQAKDMMLADLTGGTSLATIAAACGLSGAHFARAFRQSTDLPPHAWLNKARVERAMMLLRERRKSLSEIALECGFSDQSHFTRVFARRVGCAPGAWRRTLSS